jgi:hypothetical protein
LNKGLKNRVTGREKLERYRTARRELDSANVTLGMMIKLMRNVSGYMYSMHGNV